MVGAVRVGEADVSPGSEPRGGPRIVVADRLCGASVPPGSAVLRMAPNASRGSRLRAERRATDVVQACPRSYRGVALHVAGGSVRSRGKRVSGRRTSAGPELCLMHV